MRLAELQRTLHGALRGEVAPESVAEALGLPPGRIALYAGFLKQHQLRTLDKVFGRLKALLPAEAWEALREGFYREVPPAHFELNSCAGPFSAWLHAQLDAGDAPAPLGPAHAQLAQLEHELLAAYLHPAPHPAPGPRPQLNPTVTALELSFPLVEWVRAYDQGEVGPLPSAAEAPRLVLVYRHPDDLRVRYHWATDDHLFALKVGHEGISAAAAAEAGGLPLAACEQALAQAARTGLLVASAP